MIKSLVIFLVALGIGPSDNFYGATIRPPIYKPSPPQPPGSEEYRRGARALAEGNLTKAEEAFKHALIQAPHHIGALIGLAEIAMKRGESQVAQGHLHHALEIAPNNAAVQEVWGRFLTTQGRFEEAKAAYQKGIELSPNLVGLYFDLGSLYLGKLNDPQKAITIFQAGLRVDPSHIGLQYALGTAWLSIGQLDQAQSAFEKASKLTNTNPLPLLALSRVHAARKEFHQALELISQAIKIEPNFAQPYEFRGDIYVIQEKDDLAEEAYRKALQLQPSSAPLQVKLGQLYERNGKFAQAVLAFETAIKLDSQQMIAYNNLAWISAQHQTRLDEALLWAQKAVQLSPDSVAFQDTLGWVHRARGELDEAAEVLERASSQKPELADVFYHLGVVRAEQGKTQQAIEALEKALSLQQDFPEVEDARQRLKKLNNS